MRAIAPRGHHQPILAACYTPIFGILVTGDSHGIICVWDVKSGARVFQFEHVGKLTSMRLEEGGRRLLTGSSDGVLRLWNYSSGKLLYEMSASAVLANANRSLRVGASGQDVSAGSPGPITVVQQARAPASHSSSQERARGDENTSCEVAACLHVQCRASHLDCFVAVGWMRDVCVWNNEGYQKPMPELPGKGLGDAWALCGGHEEDVNCVAFCPPNLLCTASCRGEILMWNLQSGRLKGKMRVPTRVRASGERGEAAQTMDALCEETAAAIESLIHLDGYPPFEVFASILISGSADGWIRLWNPHSATLLLEIDAINSPMRAPTITSGVATRSIAKSQDHDERGAVTAVCAEPTATLLASADSLGRVRLWDVEGLAYCTTSLLKKARMEQQAVDDENSSIGTGGGPQGAAPATEAINERLSASGLIGWTAHTKDITTLEYAVNVDGLISASIDCTVRLWSLSGEVIGLFGQPSMWSLELFNTWNEREGRENEQKQHARWLAMEMERVERATAAQVAAKKAKLAEELMRAEAEKLAEAQRSLDAKKAALAERNQEEVRRVSTATRGRRGNIATTDGFSSSSADLIEQVTQVAEDEARREEAAATLSVRGRRGGVSASLQQAKAAARAAMASSTPEKVSDEEAAAVAERIQSQLETMRLAKSAAASPTKEASPLQRSHAGSRRNSFARSPLARGGAVDKQGAGAALRRQGCSNDAQNQKRLSRRGTETDLEVVVAAHYEPTEGEVAVHGASSPKGTCASPMTSQASFRAQQRDRALVQRGTLDKMSFGRRGPASKTGVQATVVVASCQAVSGDMAPGQTSPAGSSSSSPVTPHASFKAQLKQKALRPVRQAAEGQLDALISLALGARMELDPSFNAVASSGRHLLAQSATSGQGRASATGTVTAGLAEHTVTDLLSLVLSRSNVGRSGVGTALSGGDQALPAERRYFEQSVPLFPTKLERTHQPPVRRPSSGALPRFACKALGQSMASASLAPLASHIKPREMNRSATWGSLTSTIDTATNERTVQSAARRNMSPIPTGLTSLPINRQQSLASRKAALVQHAIDSTSPFTLQETPHASLLGKGGRRVELARLQDERPGSRKVFSRGSAAGWRL